MVLFHWFGFTLVLFYFDFILLGFCFALVFQSSLQRSSRAGVVHGDFKGLHSRFYFGLLR